MSLERTNGADYTGVPAFKRATNALTRPRVISVSEQKTKLPAKTVFPELHAARFSATGLLPFCRTLNGP
jgi:hypothetical protein